MSGGLDKYRAKRRFSATPEPEGKLGAASSEPVFVVQKHHASHMHYDLRLEVGGTLKSWAVPEGPCLDPKIRRFAKQTEDHPMEYATFEGRIPDGNYGAGNMIVWDRGTWVTLERDPEAAIAKGEMKFRLMGEKLGGGWMLKRLPDGDGNWLLIKERDIAARPMDEYDVLTEAPNSVITGRPVEEAEPEPAPRTPARKRPASKLKGAVAKPIPRTFKPQLAGQADIPPRGAEWIHEIKYDGYRTIAFLEGGKARLITRNGHDWTHRYGAVAKALEQIPCKSAILDGEICVQDARGVTTLDLLERALSEGDTHSMIYFAFDLTYLDGYDLTNTPLIERKEALQALLDPVLDATSQVQFSDHIEGDGDALFAQASRMGLEGIVSKKREARYLQSRSTSWIKVKKVEISTFVIVGYLSNMPRSVSSLVIAEERDGELVFASRVGSGISEEKGRALYALLSKHVIPKPVIDIPKLPGPKSAIAAWVEPLYQADVGYRARSVNDAPRAPVLMGWSEREEEDTTRVSKPRIVSDRDLASIHLTNPERQIGPAGDTTKLDIALYYARVGDWLLPELLNRPLTVIRCPSGDIHDLFYQRHAFAGLPPGVESIDIRVEGDERPDYITVREARGFLGLPQFGALEFHLWGCHADDPEHPDRIVMDLDPDESLPWARICDGAELVKERFERMGFQPFLRTTGGKGVHVVVSLEEGRHDWPTVKGFSEAFSRAMAADSPQLFTAMATKERRKGRIYLDYLRNARGASAVASYSLRAKPGFPVATPIAWEELRKISGGNAFNRVNLFRRLDSLVTDPWDELESTAVNITPKMRRDVGMKA